MTLDYEDYAKEMIKIRGINSKWTSTEIRILLKQFGLSNSRCKSVIRSMISHDVIRKTGEIPYFANGKEIKSRTVFQWELTEPSEWVKRVVIEWRNRKLFN